MRGWTFRRVRAALRQNGPTSIDFRRRIALIGGAVLVGIAALSFAQAADVASLIFARLTAARWWLPLIATPVGFMLLAWLTRRFAPLSGGSGIPQIIAAIRMPPAASKPLLAMQNAIWKCSLTLCALLIGASVGREGPTVQVSASLLAWVHGVLKVPMRASVMIAGGAAGVAAAFNTPLAGIAFAIEELAIRYEQRTTLLVITAVIVSGIVALSLAGDYVYFGVVSARIDIMSGAVAMIIAGVIGGALGGLFSRLMQDWVAGRHPLARIAAQRPLVTAALLGLGVAAIGCASGLTWGTGYDPARRAVTGLAELPWYFMPAKFAATLLTAFSGIPGGIFAPSLATGAGVGALVHTLMPSQSAGPMILIGMAAYFAGVVRAPLTAVIVISETTGSRGMMLPLLGAALIADGVSALICPTRLYHGLSERYLIRTK